MEENKSIILRGYSKTDEMFIHNSFYRGIKHHHGQHFQDIKFCITQLIELFTIKIVADAIDENVIYSYIICNSKDNTIVYAYTKENFRNLGFFNYLKNQTGISTNKYYYCFPSMASRHMEARQGAIYRPYYLLNFLFNGVYE